MNTSGCCPVAATNVNKKTSGKDHDAGRSRFIDKVGEHEDDHDQEGQERLGVVNRGGVELPGLYDGFDQRDEMKDHAEVGGMERDLAQNFRGAG